ncbi:MAG: GAF domain-containing sensor histidine kinase [Thermodesulfobacteriota bacterium]
MSTLLTELFANDEFCCSLALCPEERQRLIRLLEEEFLADHLRDLINETEAILAIDPSLSRRQILETAAGKIMAGLNAAAASIRIFDARSFKMLNYGAAGISECQWQPVLPVNRSIAGRVVAENRSILVASLARDPMFSEKEISDRLGFHSLLAVPLRMPNFVGSSADILGSLQIYFHEDDRDFSRLEILRAEMLARRVSYVMAKKRILDMKALSDKKERISDMIYERLSNQQGIKLKDFFRLILPELDSMITLHSWSLFTLSADQGKIHQEASHPEGSSYYEDGYLYTVEHHDHFWTTVHGTQEGAEMAHERVDPSYVLIKDPRNSDLVSDGLRQYTIDQDINSILFVPLRIDGVTRHILLFFATQQRQYFTADEIDLLTFVGKEIMKAVRLEFLGDMLHDFKNPAVAVAGLAARACQMLAEDDLQEAAPRLKKYLEVVARETARLQDLALTMTGEGREELIDLGQLALERFALNNHVIAETREGIEVREPDCQSGLMVRCSSFGLERVLDNLLHNATKAIPCGGGFITLHCQRSGDMASLTIENSGAMEAEDIRQLESGVSQGRGLNIISRFVSKNHGELNVTSSDSTTSFTIKLPLAAGGS